MLNNVFKVKMHGHLISQPRWAISRSSFLAGTARLGLGGTSAWTAASWMAVSATV